MWFKRLLLGLLRWLIFMPFLLCFSYVIGPILMLVLIPGGLILLTLIGGKEVRVSLVNTIKESL